MRTEKFVKAFQKASRPKTQGYDTQAEVKRVEGGTAWVHIPGGVDETPVKLTIDAKAGDTVQVRVSGGKAFLVGNATAPPTDDTTATRAVQQITETNVVVETVKKAVAAVAKIAGNTNQYFWHTESGTDTGAHITERPQDEFLADPENGGGNLLARSNGVAARDGLAELATFSASGMVVNGYDVFGNPTEIVRLGYGEGTASGGGTNTAPYYTVGIRRSGPGIGNYSLAEGLQVVASGFASHAEGSGTTASGSCSHAEGEGSIASSLGSHAEGDATTASGGSSHAEGAYSIASGRASHAQNYFTLASSDYQTAIGTCNVEDNANTYALIIGNGTSINDRSNALTVDWSGNVNAAGQVKSKTTTGSVTITSGIFSSTWLNTQAVAGNMVNISIAGTFTDTSAKSWTTIGTVANPPAVEQQGCFWGGDTDSGVYKIDTSGNISVTTASGVAQCRFNTSYIMG